MATNYNYPDPADIEAQAKYRPGVASNIFNVLTGGLAGAVTGSTQRGQEAARARQALLQEEFGKRDEQRMMERQLIINAIQSGVDAPVGADFYEKMADLKSKVLRKTIAAGEGMGYGLGQRMGPSQYEAEPAFKIAATQAANQMAQREAELRQTRALKGPELVDALAGYKITPAPGTPVGQLESMLEMARTKAQSQIPLETSGIRAKAQLKTLQGMGFVESPINVDDMSDAEAIANAEIYGRKQQQIDYFGAADRASKADTKALRTFNQLLATPNADKNSLQEAYYNLGKKEQENEEFRIAAQVPRPANTKETESLDKYIAAVDRSSALAGSIQSLVGNRSIPDVSQESFNGLASWMRSAKNKLGTEDPSLRSINNVVQEFQALIAQQRKDFFGASLTDNEFEVAKQLFADPNQANFLPRVLELVDSIMSKDEIQRKYTRRGIFVDAETKKDYGDARSKYDKIKSELNFGNFGSARNEKKIDSLKGRLDALQAYVTNSPASMTNTASGTR